MRLVTWNLNGLDDQSVDERTEAAVFVSILGARLDQLHAGTRPTEPPDVIAFQEVTAHTYAAHLARHLNAGGYRVLPDAAPDRQNFELIAVRSPFVVDAHVEEPLAESVYGRVLHIVDLHSGSGPAVRVLTAHFDSGTDAGAVRAAQLEQVSSRIGDYGIFAGDANLRKQEWLDASATLPMTDAWETVGSPTTSRYTWRRDEYKARFDRVFCGPGIAATSMTALGVDELPGLGRPISDHLGLAVELDVRGA